MTSYNAETKPAESETKQESKAIVLVEPRPRLEANKELWDKAANLAEMLSYCRPHGCKTERGFIGKFLAPLGMRFDKKGNAHKVIGTAPVMWSCHTDTVHTRKGMQKIVFWVDKGENNDTFFGSEGPNATCLGADDTAGVWLMLEMIKAKIPGHYIFHRGEECGGVGSKWLAEHGKDLLKGIRFAIAFDRKETKSIITYQGSKKTCSDEFAKLLAEQIGMGHECDSTGMWTDTASYVDLIDECTNISVGYSNAHGRTEKLNIDYLFKLRDAMCKIDVTKFVATRKPGDNASKSYTYQSSHRGHDGWGGSDYEGAWPREADRPDGGFRSTELDRKFGYNSWYQWFGYNGGWWVPLKGVTPPNPDKWRKKKSAGSNAGVTKGWIQSQKELFDGKAELKEMTLLIKDNPAIIADLLDGQGYGPLELKEHITKCNGFIYDEVQTF